MVVAKQTVETRNSMNDHEIVTTYVVTDDILKAFGQQSHALAQMSDAEVILVAIVAALYFHNHHERALCVLRGMGYIRRGLSLSRFNRRLHGLADWLLAILSLLGQV